MRLLLLLLCCTFINPAFSQDFRLEQEVRSDFLNFRQALIQQQPDSARAYADEHTVHYFAYILDCTLHADSTALDTLFSVDKLLVITLRDGVSEALLASMDSIALFDFLVENEVLAVKTIRETLIGEVVLESDTKARGQLILKGQETPYYFNFNRENGVWKFDYTTLLPLLAESAERTLAQRERQLRR